MIGTGEVRVAAPVRTVAAALTEPWLVRACLGMDVCPDGAQWWAGQRVTLRSWVPVTLRIDRADERGLLATGTAGPFAGLRVAATVRPVAGGAVLDYVLTWPGPLARYPARRLAKRLRTLAERVAERAEQLATAPVVVGAAIIDADHRLLAQQRDRPAADAGRWEFPGGRVEPGEAEPAALARECQEELGVHIEVDERLGADLILPSGWLLRVYTARLTGDTRPHPREHRAIRWVSPAELPTLDWLPADRVLLPRLLELLR